MIYIAINDEGKATGWGTDRSLFEEGTTLISRWDYRDFEHVTELAHQLHMETGKLFLPVDAGDWVRPRYDVIEAPLVGDEVSYAFNGDYYPCGKIIRISPSYRTITTDSGKVFYRKKQTGRWVYSKTWTLVKGHHHRQNPEY